MKFEQGKKSALQTMSIHDRSNKGTVDKPISKLLDKINKLNDYYTTSSCSGRIILIKVPESGKKKEAEFIYRSHELANPAEVVETVKKIKEGSIWFRMEPAILHVAARTLEDASKFLRIARPIGFKRSGIFEVSKRTLMEMVSTERIETIISENGELLVSEEYIKLLVKEGNKRLEKNWEKINKLEKKLVFAKNVGDLLILPANF